MKQPRGYLLMEAMIGGAMAAVIILGIVTLIADARVKRVAAARDVLASQFVLEKIEEVRNGGFPPTGGSDAPAPGYTRTVTVGASTTDTLIAGPPAIKVTSAPVTVVVSYESNALVGTAGTTRRVSSSTRVYQ